MQWETSSISRKSEGSRPVWRLADERLASLDVLQKVVNVVALRNIGLVTLLMVAKLQSQCAKPRYSRKMLVEFAVKNKMPQEFPEAFYEVRSGIEPLYMVLQTIA